ncbi:hypothetical protein JAAARDRAFT_93261, partial [Jaapia argillacea MUCL 33604]
MELILTKNDPTQTILLDSAGMPAYKVDTPWTHSRMTTTITHHHPSPEHHHHKGGEDEDDYLNWEEIARIEWHPLRPSDFVVDGKKTKSKEMLKKERAFLKTRTRVFVGKDRQSYRWVVPCMKMGHLKIARFNHPSWGILSQQRKAYLEIHPPGMHMVDEIVSTFVYVEKRLRDGDR